MNKRNGIVRWFDSLSGQGMIRDSETGQSLLVYSCNIIGAKTAFEHTACMYLNQGESVTFEIDETLGAVSVSGGHLDSEKWNRIKDQNLAFRKNENGEFINGLFNGGES